MSYYDFRDNSGFYHEQDNSQEIIMQQLAEHKARSRKTLVIFLIIAILCNALAIYIIRIDMVYNLARNIEQELSETLRQEITDEILLEHRREYYLPENYTSIGLIVASEAIDSVLELNAYSGTRASKATAIVINEDGYVITNAHVVTYERTGLIGGRQAYSTIKANFINSNVQYDLTLIHYNANSDLAILRFNNPPAILKPIVFADSDLIKMGEECAVLGNAEGLGTTLTTGCISNTPRNYDGTEVIQTDAAINPGNSGGPILNVYAELVAIATFKIIASEASEGMGFGVTSNEVRDYISTVNTITPGVNITYVLSDR